MTKKRAAKRDADGTAVYGKNGNDNGKFGFKNGPSLAPALPESGLIIVSYHKCVHNAMPY